jgi:hypothetical protein
MANEIFSSITAPNTYSGEQIVIKTGRIVLNSSTNDIILAAKNSIALAANKEIHINSFGDMHLNVSPGSKILIGKPDKDRKAYQSTVLGKNLNLLIEDLLQILVTLQVTTPSGEGQVGPKTASAIQKLKKKYFKKDSPQYILSDLLFIIDNKKK